MQKPGDSRVGTAPVQLGLPAKVAKMRGIDQGNLEEFDDDLRSGIGAGGRSKQTEC